MTTSSLKRSGILFLFVCLLLFPIKVFADIPVNMNFKLEFREAFNGGYSYSFTVIAHFTAAPTPVCGYSIYKDGQWYARGSPGADNVISGFGGGYGTYAAFKAAKESYLASNYYNHTYMSVGNRGCMNQPSYYEELIPQPMPAIPATRQVQRKDVTAVGEPINVADGCMFTEHTDVSVPAKELPLELTRFYNSQDDYTGQFGFRWRSNFDVVLTQYPDGAVTVTAGDGVVTIFERNEDGTYQTSPGKYSVLTKNIDGTFILTEKHVKKSYFDAFGRLTKIEGRNGNAITLTRDANGWIIQAADDAGRTLVFTHDGSGKVTALTDPANRTYAYTYDANGDLNTVTDSLNHVTTYQYGSNHRLTQITDANNHNTYFQYDPSGRVYHSWQDTSVNVVTLVFDPDNSVTTVTDSRNNATQYHYNSSGLVTLITDSQNHTQATVWDENFNKLSTTDQNNHTTSYTYDTRGNVLTVTTPLNNITTFTYDPTSDFVHTVTDAQNHLTTFNYDTHGNLITITDADNKVTSKTYDTSGQLLTSTDPLNHTTTFTYDQYGNLATTTDALNHTTTYTYDIVGNRTQVQDAKNNITHFTFNALNQLIQVTYPDNSTVTYTYDGTGNRLSVTDNANTTTNYTYDLNGKVTSIIAPLNRTIGFTYDSEGNLVKVTDQNLHETNYVYDSLNRLISETNSLDLVKTYAYDPAGNRTGVTDAKNNTISYSYDSLNRLTSIQYPVGSTSFTYDTLGRRQTMVDSRGTTTYTYDVLSRLSQIDGPGNNDTFTYVYNELGNRTSMTMPGGTALTYAYDALGRLSTITAPGNKVSSYAYDEVGNLTSVTYPNNVKTTYVYDSLRRLTHLTTENQVTHETLAEYVYTYDQAGRRNRVTMIDGVVDYGYDALGQLISEEKTSGTNQYQLGFEYDPAGNRTRLLRDGSEHLYTYNNANRLTEEDITGPALMPVTVTGSVADSNGIQTIAVNGTAGTIDGSTFTCTVDLSPGANTLTVVATDVAGNTAQQVVHVSYSRTGQILYVYDNNGNLTSKQSASQTLNLGYDYENRLTSAAAAGLSLTYAYDGEGKRTSTLNGSNLTNYLYDGMDVVLERDGSNNPVTTYLRNPYAQGGIGGILSSQHGSNPEEYYSYDGLGSVAELTDATGAAVNAFSYDAFGNLLTDPAQADAHQFLTKGTDPTGFIYFGARYYDPSIGRFITQDPSGMADGPNMYLYCLNDPINFVDVFGLCSEKISDQELLNEAFGKGNWQPLVDKLEESLMKPMNQEQIMQMVIGFSGGIKPIGRTVPLGFLKTIQSQTSKSLQKAIKSLTNRMGEHFQKIADYPDSRYITHWRREIEAFKEQINWITKELLSRK